jgi:hypothetical protein
MGWRAFKHIWYHMTENSPLKEFHLARPLRPQTCPLYIPTFSCLQTANDKSQQLLRAKALECASLVGMAVGVERFRADAHTIMQFMQHLQMAGLEADDPMISYMQQVCAMDGLRVNYGQQA